MPAINYIASARNSQVRRESGQRVVTEISLESVPDPTPQGAMVTGGSEESSADPVMEDFVTRMAELGYVDGEDYTSETLFQYNSLETLYPEYVSDYEESTANLSIVIGECCYSDLRFWYHPDYLGSIAMVTNDDGELHQYFFYNAWGENMYTFEPNNSFNSPYRFNDDGVRSTASNERCARSAELDEETGLAYYRARYYDNQLSMWLSMDPLAMSGKNMTMSPYQFTENNPVMMIDPDGMNANPVYNIDGEHIGNTTEGFVGEILVYHGSQEDLDFTSMTVDQAKSVQGMSTLGNDVKNGNISNDAFTAIMTNIADYFDGSEVFHGVSRFDFGSVGGEIVYKQGNPNVHEFEYDPKTNRISATQNVRFEYTVENVQTAIIAHEYFTHKMQDVGSTSGHYRAYFNELKYAAYHNLNITPQFRREAIERMRNLIEKNEPHRDADAMMNFLLRVIRNMNNRR